MATPPDFSAGEVLTAAQMNQVGLWLVKTQTIGSAVSSVTVTNAFNENFDNYKIVISGGVGSTNGVLKFNFVGSTTGYYGGVMYYAYNAGGPGNVSGFGWNNTADWSQVGNFGTNNILMNIDVMSPNLSKVSSMLGAAPDLNTAGSNVQISGFHNSTTAYTDFKIQTSIGTLTGGEIRVYGYRN